MNHYKSAHARSLVNLLDYIKTTHVYSYVYNKYDYDDMITMKFSNLYKDYNIHNYGKVTQGLNIVLSLFSPSLHLVCGKQLFSDTL